MIEIVNIAHPFQTVEEFQQLVGKHLSELIHRLAGKYPRLLASCGMKRVLLAVSVAWGLSGVAKAGCVDAFAHIDDALQPPMSLGGCVKAPPGGLVMVKGQPFFICEGEQGMLRFLWDGFAIFIDHEGCERVRQEFFDLADLRQSKAYAVMGECQEELNNQEYQQEYHQETKQENKEEIQQEYQPNNPCLEPAVRENHEELHGSQHLAIQSTAKNCSADNPFRENISQEIISQENYSNDTPFTANCKQTNSKQANSLQPNCKQANSLTFKEMMLCQIAYVCDIDLIRPEQVETLKDQLEYLLDSPLAKGLSSDDILQISKKIRGIKPCRIDRMKAREAEAEQRRLEAEQRRLEAEHQLLAMKAAISAGVGVTNNFNGPIAQWIASVGEVTYNK